MARDEGVVGIQLQGTETLYIRRAENRHASHQQSQQTSAFYAGATRVSTRALYRPAIAENSQQSNEILELQGTGLKI